MVNTVLNLVLSLGVSGDRTYTLKAATLLYQFCTKGIFCILQGIENILMKVMKVKHMTVPRVEEIHSLFVYKSSWKNGKMEHEL